MKRYKSSQRTPTGGLGGSRRYLYRLLVIVATLVVCEICSFLVVWIRDGEVLLGRGWFDRQNEVIQLYSADVEIDASKELEGREFRDQTGLRRDIIHPYLGYVCDPTKTRFANQLGFRGKYPLQERSDDNFIVAILGGSVAEGFSVDGMPTVERELKRHVQFEDKKFVIVNLANGGYKQPQQLLTLSLLLTLGGQFDAVINLDGFNEVALDEGTNAATDTFPAYPYFWNAFVRPTTDSVTRRIVGRKEYLKSQIVSLAESSVRAPRWYGITYRAFVTMRQQRLIRNVIETELELRDHLATIERRGFYFMEGPDVDFNPEQRFGFLASVWGRCSLQLDRLCRGNGIRYFHFLQPNQYVPNSKPIGPAERARAYKEDAIYKPGVEKGYRLLIDEGKQLARDGVRFVDLTMAFVDVEEPVYIDDCCHVDLNGNEIMASVVARTMFDEFSSTPLKRGGTR